MRVSLSALERVVGSLDGGITLEGSVAVHDGELVGEDLALDLAVAADRVLAVGDAASRAGQDESEGCDGGDDLCSRGSVL